MAKEQRQRIPDVTKTVKFKLHPLMIRKRAKKPSKQRIILPMSDVSFLPGLKLSEPFYIPLLIEI